MKYIKDIMERKKFRVALAGAIVAVISAVAGVQPWNHAILEVMGVVSVAIGAQGIADHGKEAEKVKEEAMDERIENEKN